jgi:hypothetical protein
LLLIVGFNLCAQDIVLSFKSEYGGRSIDSIRATNLRTKESVLISGNNILKLIDISTGIKPEQGFSGNSYLVVKIGTQTWMAENLKTTSYRNGDAIANLTDNADWSNLSSGAQWWSTSSLSQGNCYPGPNLNISGSFSFYCTMPNVGLNVRCVMD